MKLHLAILFLCQVALSQAAEPVPLRAELAATLQDRRIQESSGLARSLRHADVFWTLNDSGNDPCLFAIDKTGKTRAKVRLPDAVNFDWEDIASARNADGTPSLYIADIGDNLHVRASITVYELPEPDLPANPDKEVRSAHPLLWQARYPAGRPDAETLLVHPKTRQMFIVTKDPEGHSIVYAFPTTQPSVSGKPLVLEKVTALEFPVRAREGKRPHHACMTTAGDISPDGNRLIIATYSYLHEWTWAPGQPLAEALAKPARLLLPPITAQMEGVCYDADSSNLWFTSERLPTPLYQVRR